MDLFDLGLTKELSEKMQEFDLSEFSAGRVTQEHRERYIVSDGDNEYEAEITGNLRYSAPSREDFPAVGDWVVFKIFNPGQAIIHKVLPRKSVLARQAVGKPGELQVISANIDVAFIVQAINNNFSINRLERYLAICYASDIEPVLILSKTDLSEEDEKQQVLQNLEKRNKKLKHILLSNETGEGIDSVLKFMEKGKTYCVVGSSGVGKSSLINNLLHKNLLKTGHISTSTDKGRHITEHRELILLENGAIIIDNPGMREVGIGADAAGLRTTFQEITDLASKCRYQDCTHKSESGCAVTEAVKNGILAREEYDNYLKMIKEQERFRETAAEKRKKDKIFGKVIKNYFRDIKKDQE